MKVGNGSPEVGTGVVVSNLGTPDAPTVPALRAYLREFLSDRRVVDLPRAIWLPILHLVVLTTRPAKSAALYRKIWTAEGSPLLRITESLRRGIANRLKDEIGEEVPVVVGMRYGRPSIASALRQLRDRGCRRIVLLPLYPQYSSATTSSTFDALFAELSSWRVVPEIETIGSYHDDVRYLDALAASVRDAWREQAPADRLVFSFHGLPERYVEAGEPYRVQCEETARRVAERLELPADRWMVTFQSRFGREKWLEPATDRTLRELAKSGVRSVDVLCPGFPADCLETLEEIEQLNRGFFLEAGGERYRYIPALNDRADHIGALSDIVLERLASNRRHGRSPEWR